MRIAMLVWEYPPHVVGGLGTYSGAMAPALRAAGHDVQVFAALRDGVAPEQPDTHWAPAAGPQSNLLRGVQPGGGRLGRFLWGAVLNKHPVGRRGSRGASTPAV